MSTPTYDNLDPYWLRRYAPQRLFEWIAAGRQAGLTQGQLYDHPGARPFRPFIPEALAKLEVDGLVVNCPESIRGSDRGGVRPTRFRTRAYAEHWKRAVPAEPSSRLAVRRKDAAKLLSMSDESFDKHVRPHIKEIRRATLVLYPVAELERWVRENAEWTQPRD